MRHVRFLATNLATENVESRKTVFLAWWRPCRGTAAYTVTNTVYSHKDGGACQVVRVVPA